MNHYGAFEKLRRFSGPAPDCGKAYNEKLCQRSACEFFQTGGQTAEAFRADVSNLGKASRSAMKNIAKALWEGNRGFPSGDSLGKLLSRKLDFRNRMALAPLTEEIILAWVD